MRSVFEIIAESFKKWYKNLVIVLPFVFSAIATFLGLLILLTFFTSIFLALFNVDLSFLQIAQFSTGTTADPQVINQLLSIVSPFTIIYILVALAVSVFLLFLIKAYFLSGAIGMSSKILRNKKISLKDMNYYGKNFFTRYFLIKLIIFGAILLWLVIFSLPAIVSGKTALIFIPILSLIPLAFLYLLSILSEYYLILNNTTALGAIRQSISTAKRNYLAILGLYLIYFLAYILTSFIPLVNPLIVALIVEPTITIAFVLFSLDRYKR